MKELVNGIIWIALILVAPALLNRGCNNDSSEKPGVSTNSHAHGWIAHTDYSWYPDGSQEVKRYPDFLGHRWLSDRLFMDFDGDNITDRIRVNGSELFFNELDGIYNRDNPRDFEEMKEDFLDGDRYFREEQARARR